MDRSISLIQLFYDDPVIRRNPLFIFDLNEETALPADPVAYNDALKINGDEFGVAVVPAGDPPVAQVWPQLVVAGGGDAPVNPDIITGPDYDGIDGILMPLLCGGRIVVDIGVLTGPPEPGDLDEYYAFMLFHPDGSHAAHGTFMVPAQALEIPGPSGIDWAVNVFDRVDLQLSDREFLDRTVDSSTVGTVAPDIIWAEFGDGWVFSALEAPADRPYTNVHLQLTDHADPLSQLDLHLDLRVIGMTPNNSYLALHEVVREEYFDLANPGFGILRKGHSYDVALDDARTPELDFVFTEQLLIEGDLPAS